MGQQFLRHIAACNTADLPGGRIPVLLGGVPVGWAKPEVAAALGRAGAAELGFADTADLESATQTLVSAGLCRWRGEAFDVRAHHDSPARGTIDRGALPCLGIQAIGVHVNGLVRRRDGVHLWVARRAANKTLDPGKLDHLVAGGVAAGMDAATTLVKEAGEEAAIPPDLARQARHVGRIAYAMERPEGLRRDMLECYDLDLSEEFIPHPADGEVAGFELWPIARVVEAVRATEDFKFNVNLVLIDLFLRLGLIDPASGEARDLRRGRYAPGG